MHQTWKCNQYPFGAKAHIGVDSKEMIVHSVYISAASVHDKPMLPDLLHGDEKKVWGDASYQGQTDILHQAAPEAQDMTCRRVKKAKGAVDEQEKLRDRRLRLHEAALSRTEEESPVAADGLRAGPSLPTPQTAGPARGVVSLEVETGLPRCKIFPHTSHCPMSSSPSRRDVPALATRRPRNPFSSRLFRGS